MMDDKTQEMFFSAIAAHLGFNSLFYIPFAKEQARCEDTDAKNNPLATTEPWPKAKDYNSAGVKNYATFADGIAATIATIDPRPTGGIDYYPILRFTCAAGVIQEIHRNDLAREIDSWGTHDFANEIRDGWNPVLAEPAPEQPLSLTLESVYNYVNDLNTAVIELEAKLAQEPALTLEYKPKE